MEPVLATSKTIPTRYISVSVVLLTISFLPISTSTLSSDIRLGIAFYYQKTKLSNHAYFNFNMNDTRSLCIDDVNVSPTVEKSGILHSLKTNCYCSDSIDNNDFERLSIDNRDSDTTKESAFFHVRNIDLKFQETPNNCDKSASIHMSQSSNQSCRRNSMPSTPIIGYSLATSSSIDSQFDTSLDHSYCGNSGTRHYNSLSDDLLVPQLEASDITTIEFFHNDYPTEQVEDLPYRSNNRFGKKSGMCSKVISRSIKIQEETLCMSSFSRRRVLTKNLHTPENISRILLPIFPLSE